MTGEVRQVKSGGYIVASLSVPGAWRYVEGRSCSCPAGKARTCRHRRAVAEFCAGQNREHNRPVAPPHVAALCD